jgi:hypothetical protein
MKSRHSSQAATSWLAQLLRGVVRWRFFLGACFLTGALVTPLAGVVPVATGMVLAGIVQIVYLRVRRALAGGREAEPD